MLNLKLIFIVLCSSCFFVITGCSTGDDKPELTEFQQLASKGKQIFRANNCSKCHNDSTSTNQFVPDLKRPFLAGNEVLVDLHLNNQEISFMPEFELTKEEIKALSFYVSTLHASVQKTVSEEDADTRCPVCFAPVSIKIAEKDSLVFIFSGKKYYFECKECMELFRSIPEPYAGS